MDDASVPVEESGRRDNGVISPGPVTAPESLHATIDDDATESFIVEEQSHNSIPRGEPEIVDVPWGSDNECEAGHDVLMHATGKRFVSPVQPIHRGDDLSDDEEPLIRLERKVRVAEEKCAYFRKKYKEVQSITGFYHLADQRADLLAAQEALREKDGQLAKANEQIEYERHQRASLIANLQSDASLRAANAIAEASLPCLRAKMAELEKNVEAWSALAAKAREQLIDNQNHTRELVERCENLQRQLGSALEERNTFCEASENSRRRLEEALALQREWQSEALRLDAAKIAVEQSLKMLTETLREKDLQLSQLQPRHSRPQQGQPKHSLAQISSSLSVAASTDEASEVTIPAFTTMSDSSAAAREDRIGIAAHGALVALQQMVGTTSEQTVWGRIRLIELAKSYADERTNMAARLADTHSQKERMKASNSQLSGKVSMLYRELQHCVERNSVLTNESEAVKLGMNKLSSSTAKLGVQVKRMKAQRWEITLQREVIKAQRQAMVLLAPAFATQCESELSAALTEAGQAGLREGNAPPGTVTEWLEKIKAECLCNTENSIARIEKGDILGRLNSVLQDYLGLQGTSAATLLKLKREAYRLRKNVAEAKTEQERLRHEVRNRELESMRLEEELQKRPTPELVKSLEQHRHALQERANKFAEQVTVQTLQLQEEKRKMADLGKRLEDMQRQQASDEIVVKASRLERENLQLSERLREANKERQIVEERNSDGLQRIADYLEQIAALSEELRVVQEKKEADISDRIAHATANLSKEASELRKRCFALTKQLMESEQGRCAEKAVRDELRSEIDVLRTSAAIASSATISATSLEATIQAKIEEAVAQSFQIIQLNREDIASLQAKLKEVSAASHDAQLKAEREHAEKLRVAERLKRAEAELDTVRRSLKEAQNSSHSPQQQQQFVLGPSTARQNGGAVCPGSPPQTYEDSSASRQRGGREENASDVELRLQLSQAQLKIEQLQQNLLHLSNPESSPTKTDTSQHPVTGIDFQTDDENILGSSESFVARFAHQSEDMRLRCCELEKKLHSTEEMLLTERGKIADLVAAQEETKAKMGDQNSLSYKNLESELREARDAIEQYKKELERETALRRRLDAFAVSVLAHEGSDLVSTERAEHPMKASNEEPSKWIKDLFEPGLKRQRLSLPSPSSSKSSHLTELLSRTKNFYEGFDGEKRSEEATSSTAPSMPPAQH